jgi:hypothetical protein
MEKKVCSKCKEEKEVCEFSKRKDTKDGHRNECKVCVKGYHKVWRTQNPNKYPEYNKQFIIDNPEARKKIIKKYKEKNKEKIKNYNRQWRQNNKGHINNYMKNKRKNDLHFHLISIVRCRLNEFLRIRKITKRNNTINIVGCSPEYLKVHIESLFTEGMSWELLGQHIHIDHKIPLSSAKNKEEIYKLCHYTNLQPLWAFDNLSKSNKIL